MVTVSLKPVDHTSTLRYHTRSGEYKPRNKPSALQNVWVVVSPSLQSPLVMTGTVAADEYVGNKVGNAVGSKEGLDVGSRVGNIVGDLVGRSVGSGLGNADGAFDGFDEG